MKQNAVQTLERADMVIVGNGIAGLTAAVEARRLEPAKSIVIMTSQSHPTIHTPALKQFAIGKVTREQLLAYPAGTERLQRIHVMNACVDEIHASEKYLRLAGGQGFGYDSLLLATGSCPTGLPSTLPGQDFDGVLSLHSLRDYLSLRRRLGEVDEVAVIGGGSHAIETVMVLLHWGIGVHWLIRSERCLPHILDKPASDMILERMRRAGAKILTGEEVVGIVGRVGSVAGVVTTRQQMLPCQMVLVCTGTTPVTRLAHHCDLPMKYQQGILVDDDLRTSVRDVYAAGDVAALRDPLTGMYTPRAQWYAAVLQGRVAAAAMTGADKPEDFGVPWHATRLGGISLLTVGNPLARSEQVEPLTAQRKGSYCRLSLVDDRLVGYLSLGSSAPDGLAIKRLIDEGLPVREIKKDLLQGRFDARKYFSGKRSYAMQRMVTTGQLPTPLPSLSVSDLLAGAGRDAKRTRALPPLLEGQDAKRTRALPSLPEEHDGQRTTEALRVLGTGPLALAHTGSLLITLPTRAFRHFVERERSTDEQERLDAVQTDARPALSETEQTEVVELVARVPERQFIAPFAPLPAQSDEVANPHPSHSLWHYTKPLPAVEDKRHA